DQGVIETAVLPKVLEVQTDGSHPCSSVDQQFTVRKADVPGTMTVAKDERMYSTHFLESARRIFVESAEGKHVLAQPAGQAQNPFPPRAEREYPPPQKVDHGAGEKLHCESWIEKQ